MTFSSNDNVITTSAVNVNFGIWVCQDIWWSQMIMIAWVMSVRLIKCYPYGRVKPLSPDSRK